MKRLVLAGALIAAAAGVFVVQFFGLVRELGDWPVPDASAASASMTDTDKRARVELQSAAPSSPTETPGVEWKLASKPGAEPVAVVGDVPISPRELDEELNRILIAPSVHGGMKENKREELRKTALEELVVRELAYQKAKTDGIQVARAELDAAVHKIRGRYHSEATFKQALAAEGITFAELEHRVERDLLLKQIYKREIDDKAKVSEQDVRLFYAENKQKFVLPDSVQLQHIVINVAGRGEPAAKARVDEAYEMLKSGAGFFDVAYKYSDDEYRVLGGNYGAVHRGQLDSALEEIVFAAKPNELTGPFYTAEGWHLAIVQSRQNEHQLKYDEVKEKIRAGLIQKRRRDLRNAFIENLKDRAAVQYSSHLSPAPHAGSERD